MTPTPASIALRVLLAVSTLAAGLLAGFFRRALMAIPLLALGFTVAYIAGKLPAWRHSLQTRGAGATAALLPVTVVVQGFVTLFLYTIGYLASLPFSDAALAPLGGPDLLLAGAVALAGVVTGPLVAAMESGPGTPTE